MSSIKSSVAKSACLVCLCNLKVVIADTEFHLLFEWQVNKKYRSRYFATIQNAPSPVASLPFAPSISTLVHNFLFARESSENLQIFRTYVQDSLRARQRCLRRVQAQCPATIFEDAARFLREDNITDVPNLSWC